MYFAKSEVIAVIPIYSAPVHNQINSHASPIEQPLNISFFNLPPSG